MPQVAAPNPQADADRPEANRQAIAACGGNVRDAVKALIVANGFLEMEMKQLQAAVSNGYARGKFEPVPRDMRDQLCGHMTIRLMCMAVRSRR
jgi:hypothetical protein